MDSSFSPKDEILYLRVCHHISTSLYRLDTWQSKNRERNKSGSWRSSEGFGQEAPPKQTLLRREHEIFGTGNVKDKPRTGKPSIRGRQCELFEGTFARRDFGLPPPCRWELRSSWLFHSVHWQILTDVSGKRLVPSSEVKKYRNSWPLKMVPIGFPETSVGICHYTLWNNREERRSDLLPGHH